MQDLRLIGVHEDGVHLILGDEEGNRFSLPLDEALRSAARREHPRSGQLPLDLGAILRPKDVQAMIRAGLSAEEVAERAGWTVEKVHRYEVPILAEREHVAGLARQVRLRGRPGAHGASPTLGDRVADRLRSREIDASKAYWDSRRADRGSWTVVLTFSAGGRQRQAVWEFDPLARTVLARDDEARWLSEDEAAEMPGPIPAPHLAATNRPSRLYDVDAEGGFGAPGSRTDETVDLMAAMRERSAQRGRRRRSKVSEVPGLDRTPVEALPLAELARDPAELGPPPAAHPHPTDDPDASRSAPSSADESSDESSGGPSGGPSDVHRSGERRSAGTRPGAFVDDDRDDDDRTAGHEPDSGDESDPHSGAARRTGTDAGREAPERGPAAASGTGSGSPAGSPKPPPARKPGRTSVPSWDDIMFGRRPD
ncbi:MAG TPA: septation protein SepH [Dermatophilaceae bacterium]|nr:septation protein SepH [Dermatophilaceae bacterium]